MYASILPWFGLLALVGLAQHFAANEWEAVLWRRVPNRWQHYLKIGLYWGACGIGFFSLLVFLAVDPNLMSWMAATGFLVAYLGVAVVTASWIAWCTVNRYDCLGTRLFNILLTSGLVTYSYPVLKYFQEGVWLVFPEHTLAFALFLLSFSTVIRLSALTLGFRNLSEFRHTKDLRAFITHPRFVYASACLVLDVLWMLMLLNLMRLYPVDFRSVRLAESDLDFAMGYSQPADMMTLALWIVVFSILVNAFSRFQAFKVQDALAWNMKRHTLPANHTIAMENTQLVKKALELTNVAIVTWRAQGSSKGIGTNDLTKGTTFISPGPLHDGALLNMGEDINLPDFWKAIIHPDDYETTSAQVGRALSGETQNFTGLCRFRAVDGSWLNIRGQVEVERGSVNGLPVAVYGVHTNVTEEMHSNELLGAAKVRQLNALRMIGHDLRGALSTVLMSGTVIERFMRDREPLEVVSKNVGRMTAAANKALDFLSDAVSYARTEDNDSVGEPVSLNLHDLLEEIVSKEIDRYGPSRTKVEIRCDPTDTLLDVLQFPLTSILTNLISNAIKYTPDPRGRVRVTVRSLGAKAPGAQSSTLIEVSDDGVGIPQEFIQRLFKAFSRADNVGNIEGFGLGMAIVANAVELLDARLNVVSVPEVERGSVFTLILPNALLGTQSPDKFQRAG